MKRTTLALAAGSLILLVGPSQAQSVTLYGLIDAGVERLDHVSGGGGSVYRMPSIAGSFASRWGLRGSEPLEGGWQAVFTLESGFGSDTGALQQGGRAFGRQAYAGLSGGWGALTLGRQYSMLFPGAATTDLMLAQIYGAGAFDTYLAGPRLDNSIAYLGKFGGFTAGALYSLGRDALSCAGERGDGQECRAWSAVLKYDAARWGLAAWIDEQRGPDGSVNTPPTADLSGRTDQRAAFNGHLLLGSTKLTANYMRRRNEMASADLRKSVLWSVAAAQPVTAAVTVEVQYYDFRYDDSADDGRLLVLRGTYAFSKRTAVYTTIGMLRNRGAARFSPSVGLSHTPWAPDAGDSQTGIMAGLRHSF